jgi:transcriptional regulator with XRE-family HTH domain
MSHWVGNVANHFDIEVLEESALAMAQSTIQDAILKAGISRSDLARRMECNRSMVSRMLSGSHNLTIKTMARALAACGFEARFQHVPIVWTWKSAPITRYQDQLPAEAGSTKAVEHEAALVLPTSDVAAQFGAETVA